MKGKKVKSKLRQDELEQLKNQLARVFADYDNLQKRVERERGEIREIITGQIIRKFLPVFDMLNDAQEHLKDQGLALTIKEFSDILKSEGVEEIRADKEGTFDENIHEAIDILESTDKDGIIAEVVQSGWQFGDGRVVRPAKVKVYKRKTYN
jgi:molecular chaperone GrpE